MSDTEGARLPVLLVYLAIFIAIVWFLVLRPQKAIRRQQTDMLSRLGVGDEVVTAGGIYGTVSELEEGDTLLLEIAEDTEIRVAKSSIARIVTDTPALEAAEPEPVPDPASNGTTE